MFKTILLKSRSFLKEIEEFGNISVHWEHRSDAKAIGLLFGE